MTLNEILETKIASYQKYKDYIKKAASLDLEKVINPTHLFTIPLDSLNGKTE